MAKAKKIPLKIKWPKISWKILRPNLLPAILFVLLIITTLFTYQVIMFDRFYPQTLVGDTNISFLTPTQAVNKIQAKFTNRANQKLKFGNFTVDLATAEAKIDYSQLDATFQTGRSGSFWDKTIKQTQTLVSPVKIYLKVTLLLDKQIDTIAQAVNKPPQNAQLLYDETAQGASPSAHIQIKKGQEGLSLDKKAMQQEVANYLLTGKYSSKLPIKTVEPKITNTHVERAKQALESTFIHPLKLQFKGNIWLIDTKQLLALLDFQKGEGLLLDKQNSYAYIQKIASEIDQPVQEGLFEFNPTTKRVLAFKPSQEGHSLDQDKTYQLLIDALTNQTPRTIILPVEILSPKIQTQDVNSLGIKELIGRGISNFASSIPNRIYNINLTASKINGVLVPPGETFSFNQTVGDITAATGFKQAYVIKEGRTVLDDGGGVCQDSTTLFRAVLNAGLPVIKRTAHAYRVGYYEQGFPPGLDATVFYPSVDFQFKNDTPAHILIQAYTSGITLYVDLYGTSDGRVTTITRSAVTDQTPPPPDLRQDDPTLPKGTVKQVDWAAWGAKVQFSRTVKKAGETIISETYKSNYRPWQAVYLVGTKEP